MQISIVIPYYKKYSVFRVALKKNAAYFAGKEREVVIVLDEPSEEKQVIELIKEYPEINWRVLINRKEHGWRPPCKAINVGVRHSQGEYIFIQSPESVMNCNFFDYLPLEENSYSCGFVAFCELKEDETWEVKSNFLPYGSILVKKSNIEAIGGWCESMTDYGADDDNFRQRLDLLGLKSNYCTKTIMYHLEKGVRPKRPAVNLDLSKIVLRPNGDNWGNDEFELIYG